MIKQVGGKLVSVKWLDTSEGDRNFPNYRSRLVAAEYNDSTDDILYASTPPLEASSMIISHASTVDLANTQGRRDIVVHDVLRARFYAKQQRRALINLPEEDNEAKEGEAWQLLSCLCGTHDAAKDCQKTRTRHAQDIGLIPGRGHPSAFHHPERDLRVLVHGDGYLTS